MQENSQMVEIYSNKCHTNLGVSVLVPEVNADKVNYFINHPSVREWVSGDLKGVLDASILVNNKNNIFFTSIHGGCGFIKTAPSIFELHTFVLPEGRGSWVKENFSSVRDWIFENTDATAIVTMCPKNNRMAIGAARFCGFKKYSTMENAWTQNGEVHDMDGYVLYKEVPGCQ